MGKTGNVCFKEKKQKQHFYVVQDQDLVVLEVYKYVCTSNKSTCRQQNTMPLKDEHHQKHLPTAKHHATEGRTIPRIAQKDA